MSVLSTIIPYLPGSIWDLNLTLFRNIHEQKEKKGGNDKTKVLYLSKEIIYMVSKPSIRRSCRGLQKLLTGLRPIYSYAHFPTEGIKYKNK